jgi:serine/threonine protein kinase
MNYLHNFTLNNVKQPIIHRDLKPSNLLVNSLDVDSNAVTVKLTDFGISAFGAKTENSSSGTTAYMAPEVQERGESVTKSDVYSFGIVLWEMLTQSVPPTVKRVP